MITEKWIEIPSGYTPNDEKKKVKFKEIEMIYRRKLGRFKNSIILKTDIGEYIIRDDLKKEILALLPSNVMEKSKGDIDEL